MAQLRLIRFDPCPCCGCDPCDCDWGYTLRESRHEVVGQVDVIAP